MILILNAGSSSLRFALFDAKLNEVHKGHVDQIGLKGAEFKGHESAIAHALKALDLSHIKKVGHRVVHGGEHFKKATRLTAKVLKTIEKLSPLAPLHNPANLMGIRASQTLLPKAKHYAIFDTAFHASLPEQAYLYGLPYSLYKKEGIRRYGFHGSSHKYVSQQAAKLLGKKKHRIISCHLGNGVSIAAIKDGVCLDTSMGFTPLEGPMMGTRSGSLDPAIVFHLAQKHKLKEVQHLLEKESGFKGVSEISSDVRDLWAKPKAKGTQRAFKLFSYQMAKLILGSIAALDGTPDAIVFTAGIGEHAHYLRQSICDYLKPLGLKLKASANLKNELSISAANSSIKVYVIPTREELQMASEIN